MIPHYLHSLEEVFDKIIETLMFFTFVFQYKIICMAIFYKRYGNRVLFIEVLLNEKLCKRFLNTLEFSIEGTIVELDLFDDRGTFNVVMICIEL